MPACQCRGRIEKRECWEDVKGEYCLLFLEIALCSLEAMRVCSSGMQCLVSIAPDIPFMRAGKAASGSVVAIAASLHSIHMY